MKPLIFLILTTLLSLDVDNIDSYCNQEETELCCICLSIDNKNVLIENAVLYQIVYLEDFTQAYPSYATFLADALSFGLSYNKDTQKYIMCSGRHIRHKFLPIDKLWKYLEQQGDDTWRVKQKVSRNMQSRIYMSLFYNGYYIYKDCYRGGYYIRKEIEYIPKIEFSIQ